VTTTERRRVNTERPSAPARFRRRRWPWLLTIGLVLAVLAAGGYLVWKTPMFAVQQVAITGVKGELAQQVKSRTADRIGNPLVSVDTDAVREKVADIPEVASVTVAKTWPHTLTVTVTARVPVAVTNANGSWWLMDAAGLPYRSGASRPAGLPAIELATPGPADPATKAALQVVTALPADVTALIGKVTAVSAYRVTLVLKDGRAVIWGDGSRTAAKAKILPAVLQQPGRTFDLSDPTMITVK
jgi:cell division protein FtsQ